MIKHDHSSQSDTDFVIDAMIPPIPSDDESLIDEPTFSEHTRDMIEAVCKLWLTQAYQHWVKINIISWYVI